jgi:hypothetical protein
MDTFHVFIKKLVDAFEMAELDYAFTGAIAVSFYGAPRTTSDVDVMIVAKESELKNKLGAALKTAGLEVDKRKIEAALTSGYKIATFKGKATPYTLDIIFSDIEIEKKAGKIDGLNTFFQSPECLVAAKLRMIKATLPPERAVKDKDDVLAILAFTKVDVGAVKRQAEKDRTLDVFESLIAK